MMIIIIIKSVQNPRNEKNITIVRMMKIQMNITARRNVQKPKEGNRQRNKKFMIAMSLTLWITKVSVKANKIQMNITSKNPLEH